MTNQTHSTPLTECPHCGHDTFYTKMRAIGTAICNIRFDGEQIATPNMYDGLTLTGGKYGYCNKCHKRVCTADGYAIDQEG